MLLSRYVLLLRCERWLHLRGRSAEPRYFTRIKLFFALITTRSCTEKHIWLSLQLTFGFYTILIVKYASLPMQHWPHDSNVNRIYYLNATYEPQQLRQNLCAAPK